MSLTEINISGEVLLFGMPNCELCGNEAENLTKAKISGAKINVCQNCTSHGTKLEETNDSNNKTKYSTEDKSDSNPRHQEESKTQDSYEKTEDKYDDVSDLMIDYGQEIRQKRNERGISREDLAQSLGIKESHLRNIESESTQPSLGLQDKIEKELNIDLSMGDLEQ